MSEPQVNPRILDRLMENCPDEALRAVIMAILREEIGHTWRWKELYRDAIREAAESGVTKE